MTQGFFGGVHPDDMKRLTADKAVEILPAPAQVVVPMSMHVGAPCRPRVRVGDRVLLGQRIGESDAALSAPIHAPVSGEVAAVEPRLHPNGSKVLSVVIRSDGKDERDPSVAPRGGEPSAEEIVAIIRDRGITGMGGAAFPTHFKLSTAVGKVDTLIVNGAECEPYINSDCRTMLEHADEVADGIELAMKALGLPKATFAIEENKAEAIAAMRAACAARGGGVEVLPLRVRYPQGSEKQLIQTVTGREVPPGKLPADVGCVIVNAFTAYCIHRAVREGYPAIERIVTVSGSGVKEPKNLLVRVGTPLRELFLACGGFNGAPRKVLLGGPMMGNAQFSLDVPVLKGTNAALAFSGEEEQTVENPVCIRCGRCVEACPMHLMPVYMFQCEQKNDYEGMERLHLTDCMECGACTYVCPGKLHLTQSFRTGKAKLMAKAAADKAKAEAEKKAREEAAV